MTASVPEPPASRLVPIRCAVLTISDTATEATDRSGSYLRAQLQRTGHEVVFYDVLPDEPAQLGPVLDALTRQADALLINGGTGLTANGTFDAVEARLETTLPGFGELLRRLAHKGGGMSGVRLRAVAGLVRATVVFVVPADLQVVKLAWDQLVLPELKPIVNELRDSAAGQGAVTSG